LEKEKEVKKAKLIWCIEKHGQIGMDIGILRKLIEKNILNLLMGDKIG